MKGIFWWMRAETDCKTQDIGQTPMGSSPDTGRKPNQRSASQTPSQWLKFGYGVRRRNLGQETNASGVEKAVAPDQATQTKKMER